MQCVDLDILGSGSTIVLLGPPAPDFLPWVPRQRIVLDASAIIGYSITQVNDTSRHQGPGRRSVYITIDTLSRQHQIGVLVAEQNGSEWEPRNTSLVAKLLMALGDTIHTRWPR